MTIENTEFDELDEAAVDTLKPGGAAGESKAVMLDTFVQLLAQLGKEDLSYLFDQAQNRFGPNADVGVGDNSEQNRATIAAKPSAAIKEDMEDLFAGDELSEEMKEKASVIFEAAVNTRLTLELSKLAEEYTELEAALNEEFEQRLTEAREEILESTETKLDQYIEYVVEQWMEDNKLAVESGIRTDIAENFITGLHNLFSEHYITVPENKIDLVAEMKTELDEVRSQLNEALDRNIELEVEVTSTLKESILADATVGMVATQAEKLRDLVEHVEFTDADAFARKVSIIKEHQFSTKRTASTGMITESIAGEELVEDSAVPVSDPTIGAYVNAISKSKK